MRNDVKLGFAIGGVLLAVLIVYVLVVPGGSSSQPKKVSTSSQQNGGSTGSTASKSDTGKVTLEPVVPPPVPNTSSTQPSVPVVPPPAYAKAGSSKTTPATPPAKTDPFASKSDDWNTILNQQPMLMTETPVAATGGSRTATPVTPAAPATPVAATPDTKAPAASDSTASSSDPSSDTAAGAAGAPGAAGAAATQPLAGTTPLVSSSSSVSGGARTHRIQAGETLSAISTAAYGSPAYYPAIVRANPGIDPQHLKVGVTINLPDAAAVKPSGSGGSAAAGTVAPDTGSAQHAAAHIPGTAAPTLDSSKEYRVKAGDSLHKISIKLYGRSDQADKIYQLNKQTIGDDPHRLKIGQVLQLPEPPTVSTTSR
jgi:nucleoid-associated protein YgaU